MVKFEVLGYNIEVKVSLVRVGLWLKSKKIVNVKLLVCANGVG